MIFICDEAPTIRASATRVGCTAEPSGKRRPERPLVRMVESPATQNASGTSQKSWANIVEVAVRIATASMGTIARGRMRARGAGCSLRFIGLS